MILPTWTDVGEEQRKHISPAGSAEDKNGVTIISERIWFPDDAMQLELNIRVNASWSEGGYWVAKARKNKIGSVCWWKDPKNKTMQIPQSWILCIVSQIGPRMPLPLASVIYDHHPNEVMRIKFFFLGRLDKNSGYVLITMDKLSGYTYLCPNSKIIAMQRKIVRQSRYQFLTTCCGWSPIEAHNSLHFLRNAWPENPVYVTTSHLHTGPYSPLTNEFVESVCREFLRPCLALL